ncbi:ATP-binding protein [Streptomyces albus subsp. chlorinus]|uniref:ATP-binding protein n=1 Tax=Streptomyces albus TaxID=1888 RepID=UPI00157059B3|nr:ATP-binding protein [Streptomyces albus]NSC24790.1 ATP-binding protein [Streptomyces albus subsp. chlorinus]
MVPLRGRGEPPRRGEHRTVDCAYDGRVGYARARTQGPERENSWRFTAPAADSSVPRLRHAVRDLLGRQPVRVPEDTLQGALLILSELVTNAVRHAAVLSPEIGVEIRLGGGWLRVAVEDGHPYRPKALEAEPLQEQTGGRGLLLVKTLTTEAGGVCDVERTGAGGKIVWAALPLGAVG